MFRGNKFLMGVMIFLVLGVYAFGDFIATRPYSDITTGGRTSLLSFVIWPTFPFFWVRSVRVTFHTGGISCRSLFGEKEIRGQSYPELFRKIVERFSADQELDFGAIRVSRLGRVKVKKFYGGGKEIPWTQVS